MQRNGAFVVLALVACGLLLQAVPGTAQETAKPQEEDKDKKVMAVKPKPVSDNVKKGLDWLIKSQNADGSWGQGEESQQMGQGLAQIKATPNVADTCMAVQALLRAGNTPKEGEYSKQLNKALAFLCKEIEKSPAEGLVITDQRGTRTQQKLGQFIDTFLAAHVLSEVWKNMADEGGAKMAKAAFNKVMDKIEKGQQKDGTWAQQGWATSLSQGMGAKALAKAGQSGYQLKAESLDRSQSWAQKQAAAQGTVTVSGGSAKPAARAPAASLAESAGVELYARSASLGGLQEAENYNAKWFAEWQDKSREIEARLSDLATGAKPKVADEEVRLRADLAKGKDQVKAIEENRKVLDAAQKTVVARMQDPSFAAGFGSNGGEEFLSHLTIGESLVVKGGEEWEKWDKQMTANMNRIQNQDGSWTGHHCITGRTFCTSAALLVLLVDRTQVPIAAKIGRR